MLCGPDRGDGFLHQVDLLASLEHLLRHLLESVAHLHVVAVELLVVLSHLIRVLLVDAVGNQHLKILPHHHHHILHCSLATWDQV